jgi:hypothetical protein
MVAAGILFVNTVVTGALLTRSMPARNDWWFYFNFPCYLLALGRLTFSRSRPISETSQTTRRSAPASTSLAERLG